MGQSQFTMLEVQLKIKIIKISLKPHYSLFPLMGSLGGVETKQKQNDNIPQHINRVSPLPHRKIYSGREPGPAQWGKPVRLAVRKRGDAVDVLRYIIILFLFSFYPAR